MTDLEFNLFFNIHPKDPFKEYGKAFRKEFSKTPEGREYSRKYQKKHYRTNLNHRIKVLLRSRIYIALKGNCKSKHTMELLGCTIEFFRNYYASKFTEGMSWDNVMNGKIHIDHIRPCASFDLRKPDEQLKCFNYKNLQPLWAADNLAKSNKLF